MIALAFWGRAIAGPLDDAVAAYERGDYATAARLYLPLAEQGSAQAQYSLGFMYATGRGVAQDNAAAISWYRKAAELGHASAQNNLGVIYAAGQGVPQDHAEAARWYRRAAEQGNALARNNLGFMYANGQGVPQDYAEAAKWFGQAAAQGDASAQYNLGLFYASGRGVAPGRCRGAELVPQGRRAGRRERPVQPRLHVRQRSRRAARSRRCRQVVPARQPSKGNARGAIQPRRDVQHRTRAFRATMPRRSNGIAGQRTREAREAQFSLGFIYANGRGVRRTMPRPCGGIAGRRIAATPMRRPASASCTRTVAACRAISAEAAIWYRKAADRGDAAAQYNLGVAYDTGQGVPRGRCAGLQVVRHRRDALSGVGRGQSRAGRSRAAIRSRPKMTPPQVAEAQKLAREWLPR